MSDATATDTRDYKDTLFLPKTDFPMACRPAPERAAMAGPLGGKRSLRPRCARPRRAASCSCCMTARPMPNGHIHLGTGLNKILKDFVVRTRRMAGFRRALPSGAGTAMACPSSWKVEQNYRAKGKKKDDVPVRRIPQGLPGLCG